MHLAAAVETKQGQSKNRPCIVLAGGREPVHWEAYPHHTYLHSAGALPCCDDGGCWRSRVVALGDGGEYDRSLCEWPVYISSRRVVPKCQDMISSSDVIAAIERYSQYSQWPTTARSAHRRNDLRARYANRRRPASMPLMQGDHPAKVNADVPRSLQEGSVTE
jgi:hypothetical protein